MTMLFNSLFFSHQVVSGVHVRLHVTTSVSPAIALPLLALATGRIEEAKYLMYVGAPSLPGAIP